MRRGSPAKIPFRPAQPTIEPNLVAVSLAGRRSGAESPGAETTIPRPIFVLGALRSGASLLSLSLSQHPNLYPVLETNWFERFGMGLQQAYSAGLRYRNRSLLDVAGIEIEDFYAHFGASINRLMLDTVAAGVKQPDGTDTRRFDVDERPIYRPQRWLDSTASNAYCVFVLLRLFPHARFIHVVRDLDNVVETLTTSETRGTYKSHYLKMSEDRAYRHWIDTTTACLEAEKAFGSAVVMRVRRDNLIRAPETTLQHCFEFVDEPYSPLTLRPFSSVKTVETPRSDTGNSALSQLMIRQLRAEAEALNAQLMAETPSLLDSTAIASTYAEDLGRIAAMEIDFSNRSRRFRSAVPTSLPGFQRVEPQPGQTPIKRMTRPVSFLRGIIARS